MIFCRHLAVFPQIPTGYLHSVHPVPYLLRLFWSCLPVVKLLNHFIQLHPRNRLPGSGYSANKPIEQRDEFVFEIYTLVVPPYHVGLYPERMTQRELLAVPNHHRSLHSGTSQGTQFCPKHGSTIPVITGKVQLPQEARVVHVIQHHVDVLCGADACEDEIVYRFLHSSELTLSRGKPTICRDGIGQFETAFGTQDNDDREDCPNEVVQIESDVERCQDDPPHFC